MKKKAKTQMRKPSQDDQVHYVLGFMFSADLRDVLLIRKQRPEWQRGRLNGLGGCVVSENYFQAMAREFNEETILPTARANLTTTLDWTRFAELTGKEGSWIVHCFYATARKIEAYCGVETNGEAVERYDVQSLPESLVPNCRWLIPMALTHFINRGPVCRVIEL